MQKLAPLRQKIAENHVRDEQQVLTDLTSNIEIPIDLREKAVNRAVELVTSIRNDSAPGLMEVFLAEYGLSTDEGIALMCLAEALLRVPDTDTIDALIEDKIAPSAWGEHLGKSSSSLVNASTWALLLTGKVLNDGTGVASVLRTAVKRVGEPVIRAAVGRAMKELGAQFVLGETIEAAVKRGRGKREKGFTFSYDMLGEAALTQADADDFFDSYSEAIAKLGPECRSKDIRDNPGISIKLSALHPRYEVGQKSRVMSELVERTLILAKHAKSLGMGLNIDAEEADRLDLSLDVIEAVLSKPELSGWDGFGVVVQAYGKRAAQVLDWLYALSDQMDRKIMVRLVKGAYWDTEIKRAQVEGLPGFPVFTNKTATDVSYMCCAQKLLLMTDRIYPQFATHNAHSVAAILEMAEGADTYEFQRLHGMGEALHDIVVSKHEARCRIYAPVGAHEDLLAYLVRRLLENGANSSFVNQIVDETVPPEVVGADPFLGIQHLKETVLPPVGIYAPERPNSKGWDIHSDADLAEIEAARQPFRNVTWKAGPLLVKRPANGETQIVRNPANPDDLVGEVALCTPEDVAVAIDEARPWVVSPQERAKILNRAADLFEKNFGEFFALLAREAGKTPMDAIAELREAVDFLRYYAARAPELTQPARGLFTCISPWNFPLAIFSGQIAAALAAGNGVLAKPAEPTAITAFLAVRLLHEAGVPVTALQLLPGHGAIVGAALTSDPRINGVCFTGSTATAQTINRTMAEELSPTAPLIAETGGLNAMIVDSTALPEQAVRDIVASAFQSAGQRCSALRMLYIQEDVAESFLNMLHGAMDELVMGDPWAFSTDVGPVIDEPARRGILNHIETSKNRGQILKRCKAPEAGTFVAPVVIKLGGISELRKEIFGPVLHVATYKSDELEKVLSDINRTGFGLTFGLHSRIDDRVEYITSRMKVGNMYINRNQIGAIVGSQPFGGEGLSGTGPKAGGPNYVTRFTQPERSSSEAPKGVSVAEVQVQEQLDQAQADARVLSSISLPGPTGESNQLSEYPKGVVLCLGPSQKDAQMQSEIAKLNGCGVVEIAGKVLDPQLLETLENIDAVVSFADDLTLRAYRKALSKRSGKLIPLCSELDLRERLRIERHICIDTTAAGGNATLLAEVS